jgi:multicomponent Na+:H+ antiporter subunit E
MADILRLREMGMGLFLHWLALFAFWVVLSGFFDTLHLGSGLLCTGAVALLSRELQMMELPGPGRGRIHLAATPWHRIAPFVLWMLREIAIANWQVVRIVFDPRLPAKPALVRFRTTLTTDLGKTIFANSITLTPGTITVRAYDGEFVVHALVADEHVMAGLREMERRVHAALPGIEPPAAPA